MNTKTRKSRMLPLTATLLACSLGVASNAYANAYSFAYDNVSNFFLSISNPSTNSFGTPVVTSADSATLNGSGVSKSAPPGAAFAPADAPISTLGSPTQTNNAFTPLGQTGTYSWGDAQIISQQTALSLPCGSSDCGHFANAAESNIAYNGYSTAQGNNNSGTTLTVPITIAAGGGATISFQFNAEPYIQAFLASTSAPGSKAQSYISANISIYQLNSSGGTVGNPVVSWSPDGTNGNATGLSAETDPYSLNTNLTQSIPGLGVYDPFGASFGATVGAGSLFSGSTITLDSLFNDRPSYQLSLAMQENVAVTNYVPEPATLALMGIGLLGLGVSLTRRPRRSAKS